MSNANKLIGLEQLGYFKDKLLDITSSSKSAEGSNITVTDALEDGRLQKLSIYGKTAPFTSYQISKSNDGINFEVVTTQSATTYSIEYPESDKGKTIYYKIEAYIGNELIPNNNIIAVIPNVKPTDPTYAALCPVVTTTALNNGTSINGILLQWDPIEGAASYYISKRKHGDTDWITEKTTYKSTNLIITDIDSATMYDFLVQAYVDRAYYPRGATNNNLCAINSQTRSDDSNAPIVAVKRDGLQITLHYGASISEASGLIYVQSSKTNYGSILINSIPLRAIQATTPGTGNYTDTQGVEWIADEIRLHSGVIIQRISDQMTLLPNPISTPINENILELWRRLRTESDMWSLSNSESAFMSIAYLVDTENGNVLYTLQKDYQDQIGYNLQSRLADIEQNIVDIWEAISNA